MLTLNVILAAVLTFLIGVAAGLRLAVMVLRRMSFAAREVVRAELAEVRKRGAA